MSERSKLAALFVDIVESTRLFEQDEDGTIERWRGQIAWIEAETAPRHRGHLVKSTGDGVLLAFPDARSAVAAALEVQARSRHENIGLDPERQMLLRVAIEIGEAVEDRHDVYGRGVIRAARMLSLAGPGEIVVSAGVRDEIVPALDGDVEDLGECHLKHLPAPVRAYRVGPPGPRPALDPHQVVGEIYPSVAVLPLRSRGVGGEHGVIGELLADEVITALSCSPELDVISRLSSTALGRRDVTVEEVGRHLRADYVLSGTYEVDGDRIELQVELADTGSGRIVWSRRLEDRVAGLLSHEQVLIEQIVAGASRAIMDSELRRARSQPLPTLSSYTLLIGAIALMHRLSPRAFAEAHEMLRTLAERATRQSVPHAWLGKWHVLRVQQGWSDDPEQDGRLALEYTRRALDADPCSSLALGVDGFVHTNLLKRLDVAAERYRLALEYNPNDAMAWLLKGTLHAFKGEGAQAVADTQRALRLTPLDPHRYFYESLAATASLAAHRYHDACRLARSSLRANRTHTSTLRVLAASQWHLGLHGEARDTAQELLRLEPGLTVSGWLARSPSAPYPVGREWADVLRQVGVPA